MCCCGIKLCHVEWSLIHAVEPFVPPLSCRPQVSNTTTHDDDRLWSLDLVPFHRSHNHRRLLFASHIIVTVMYLLAMLLLLVVFGYGSCCWKQGNGCVSFSKDDFGCFMARDLSLRICFARMMVLDLTLTARNARQAFARFLSRSIGHKRRSSKRV